jgi:hypothetical protein
MFVSGGAFLNSRDEPQSHSPQLNFPAWSSIVQW